MTHAVCVCVSVWNGRLLDLLHRFGLDPVVLPCCFTVSMGQISDSPMVGKDSFVYKDLYCKDYGNEGCFYFLIENIPPLTNMLMTDNVHIPFDQRFWECNRAPDPGYLSIACYSSGAVGQNDHTLPPTGENQYNSSKHKLYWLFCIIFFSCAEELVNGMFGMSNQSTFLIERHSEMQWYC